MRYVQRDTMLFLRQVRAVVFIFVAASLVLAMAFTPNVGATPVLSQSTDSVKTTMDFVLSWQASPDATAYQIRVARDKTLLQNDQDTSVWYSSWLVATELPFASIADAGDGDWFWQVRSRDVTSGTSSWSETQQLTVDTTAPEVTFVKPDGGGTYSNTVNLRLLVKDTCAGGRCIIKLDSVDITQQLQTEPQDNGVIFMGVIPIDALSEGEHMFLAIVSDEHGNKTEQTKSFTVDTTISTVTTPTEGGVPDGAIASLVGTEPTDPVLEQLSEQLSQPLVESTVLEARPTYRGSPAQSVNNRLRTNQHERPALRDEPAATSLVVPSEDGWRIFGIVWYWWFCVMVTGVILYRRRKVAVALPA